MRSIARRTLRAGGLALDDAGLHDAASDAAKDYAIEIAFPVCICLQVADLLVGDRVGGDHDRASSAAPTISAVGHAPGFQTRPL